MSIDMIYCIWVFVAKFTTSLLLLYSYITFEYDFPLY